MNHHVVAYIDAYMGSSGCVVGALKENKITGLDIRRRDSCTDAQQTGCTQAPNIPPNAAVIENIGDKTRTVET